MHLREVARPAAVILLTFGLVGLAIGDACGYPAPAWFTWFAKGIVAEYILERAVFKWRGE